MLGGEFAEDEGGGDHIEQDQAALLQVPCAREVVGGGECGEGTGEVRVEEVLAAEVVFVGDDVGFGVEVEVGGDRGCVDVGVDCRT